MSDLISRDDVYNVLKKVNMHEMPIYVFDKLWNGVRDLPSAEPERTAKVKNVDEINAHCGNCDTPVSDWWTYCARCGARLEWE